MNELAARKRAAVTVPRRRAGDVLEPAEESSFRSLAETSLQGIIVHRDWRILFANRAAAHTLGYKDVAELASTEGPALLEARVRRGARNDLGRPTITPAHAKRRFTEFLGK